MSSKHASTRLAFVALVGVAACSPDATPLASPSAAAAALRAPASDPTPSTISLQRIGGYAGGGAGAAEITAFDFVSKRLFVVNGAARTVDVLDLRRPESPTLVGTLQFGAGANSVATHNGIVAIAVEGAEKTLPGSIEFYRATTLERISAVTVGALPDMVTFSPSGRLVLVANEGEPNADYSVDPEGSVSIIDVHNVHAPVAREVSFAAFNGQGDALRASGVRLYGPNASVAQDLEPEYVTVSEDETTAYVTLQENNALAIIDLATASVRRIAPLGFKDHSLPGNGLDASDRDNAINIRNWPVFGMYQPDGIASYTVGGQTYLVTANEGDAREYTTFAEEARVSALALDPAVFTDLACGGPCRDNARLGRLTVTRTLGRNASSGLYEKLFVLGGRSVSIWDAEGAQVWDSGDQFEQLTTAIPNANFNASNTGNTRDDRSDNKGPEPEGVVLGQLGAKTFAFIGLERIGGVMVYDVTTPASPFFVTYLNTRDGSAGDLGPEGITFVPANRSPNKEPLLIVGNEVSGTTTVFRVLLH